MTGSGRSIYTAACIAFAIICAKKKGAPERDDEDTRKILVNNADWAQRAYNGTDINLNHLFKQYNIYKYCDIYTNNIISLLYNFY